MCSWCSHQQCGVRKSKECAFSYFNLIQASLRMAACKKCTLFINNASPSLPPLRVFVEALQQRVNCDRDQGFAIPLSANSSTAQLHQAQVLAGAGRSGPHGPPPKLKIISTMTFQSLPLLMEAIPSDQYLGIKTFIENSLYHHLGFHLDYNVEGPKLESPKLESATSLTDITSLVNYEETITMAVPLTGIFELGFFLLGVTATFQPSLSLGSGFYVHIFYMAMASS
ncbi:hypothetical protein F5880DRAFT_1502476 [Lentinula raphanica]|nr:hypothetical protein F5880DRAFT_1502476 [Lentinula raphanica]